MLEMLVPSCLYAQRYLGARSVMSIISMQELINALGEKLDRLLQGVAIDGVVGDFDVEMNFGPQLAIPGSMRKYFRNVSGPMQSCGAILGGYAQLLQQFFQRKDIQDFSLEMADLSQTRIEVREFNRGFRLSDENLVTLKKYFPGFNVLLQKDGKEKGIGLEQVLSVLALAIDKLNLLPVQDASAVVAADVTPILEVGDAAASSADNSAEHCLVARDLELHTFPEDLPRDPEQRQQRWMDILTADHPDYKKIVDLVKASMVRKDGDSDAAKVFPLLGEITDILVKNGAENCGKILSKVVSKLDEKQQRIFISHCVASVWLRFSGDLDWERGVSYLSKVMLPALNDSAEPQKPRGCCSMFAKLLLYPTSDQVDILISMLTALHTNLKNSFFGLDSSGGRLSIDAVLQKLSKITKIVLQNGECVSVAMDPYIGTDGFENFMCKFFAHLPQVLSSEEIEQRFEFLISALLHEQPVNKEIVTAVIKSYLFYGSGQGKEWVHADNLEQFLPKLIEIDKRHRNDRSCVTTLEGVLKDTVFDLENRRVTKEFNPLPTF